MSLSNNPVGDPGALTLRGLRALLKLGSTPADVVHRRYGIELLRYRLDAGARRHGTPVLLVPSLINRHYILDLQPGKSLVEYLLSEGYAVYLARWETPEPEDRYLSLDRLIGTRLHDAVSAVLDDDAAGRVHLAGQCLGGTFGLLYALRFPERIESLTLLTTPIDFHRAETLLGRWTRHPAFRTGPLIEAYGNAPWPLMHAAFRMMNPVSGVTRYFRVAGKLAEPAFRRNFLALELWSADNVSFPGGCFSSLVDSLYRENRLLGEGVRIRGRQVRLGQLPFRTLNIAARGDDIVPVESTLRPGALDEGVRPRLTDWTVPGGHIGGLLGSRAQRDLWPRWAAWLAEGTARSPGAR